MLKISLKKM